MKAGRCGGLGESLLQVCLLNLLPSHVSWARETEVPPSGVGPGTDPSQVLTATLTSGPLS